MERARSEFNNGSILLKGGKIVPSSPRSPSPVTRPKIARQNASNDQDELGSNSSLHTDDISLDSESRWFVLECQRKMRTKATSHQNPNRIVRMKTVHYEKDIAEINNGIIFSQLRHDPAM